MNELIGEFFRRQQMIEEEEEREREERKNSLLFVSEKKMEENLIFSMKINFQLERNKKNKKSENNVTRTFPVHIEFH